jgi:hypothetical protein
MPLSNHFVSVAVLLLGVGIITAQAPNGADPRGQPKHAERVAKQDAANRVTYQGKPDVLVLPGLVANRVTKRVEVTVESTGLGGGEACEYLVIGADGDHGYEALLWSYAKPSDVHKALEFIDIEAGAPYNPGELRFWAKGERVIASIIEPESDSPARIESFVVNGEAGKPLRHEGFVFCGSLVMPDQSTRGVQRYLADQLPSRSILPAYNEPASVCDVTYRASKGEVYQSHVVNPKTVMPPNQLATLRLEPEYTDGKRRVVDLRLAIGRSGFRLSDVKGKSLNQAPGLDAVLNSCFELMKDGRTPYISLALAADLQLGRIPPLAQMIAKIDVDAAIRIEPPASGQLYYKAFLPDPRWREVSKRISQPWELHLEHVDGNVAATMVYHTFTWKPGELEPDVTKQRHVVADTAAIRRLLDEQLAALKKRGKRLPPAALIVFAPADLAYGELMRFVGPLQSTHPAMYVFLQ